MKAILKVSVVVAATALIISLNLDGRGVSGGLIWLCGIAFGSTINQ